MDYELLKLAGIAGSMYAIGNLYLGVVFGFISRSNKMYFPEFKNDFRQTNRFAYCIDYPGIRLAEIINTI